jgi:glycosyltransferase involved in cell wall biosynthesis
VEIYVGIPAFNEEKNIASLIVKIQDLGYKILICDDASTDSTGLIAKKLGATVIQHSRNLGYGRAIQSLFSSAKELNADILITIDADGQHDYRDIKKILAPILEQKASLVIGSRFLEKKSDMPKYRELGIKTLTKITNAAQESKISDSQSGFRAYDKTTLEKINPTEEGMGISTEILLKASDAKLKIFEVPIVVSYEGDTSTHNPVSHGLSVLATTVKIISIKHPILFYGVPGLFFFALGLVFTVLTLSTFSETRTIVTNQALLAIGSIVVGLVLIMTSVILTSVISVIRERRN